MTSTRDSSGAWLYGPGPDLFFGCGLLFVVASIVFGLGGAPVFDAVPLAVPALGIALISAPHYGATLVRVYDQRADRRAYFFFSVVVTIGLIALFGVALFERWTGSILATVYLTWSGWHYTGQNFGIATMFLRRRAVEIDGAPRRLLHSSFILSFLLVFLVMHGQEMPLADPGLEVRLIPLALPTSFTAIAVPAVLFAYLATTVGWIGLLGRRAERFRDLAPSILLALVQALWWSVPYLSKRYGFAGELIPLGWDSRSAFFPWIACAHALQYLWITSYYARSSGGASGRWGGQGRIYGSVLLAGSAIWALPALLFAPGVESFDWNFALLLAATVNLHHFILDGAIWKLRSSRVAKVLIVDSPKGHEEEAAPKASWLRHGVWAASVVGLVLTAHSLAEQYVIEPAVRRSGDLTAVAASLDRQGWLGKNDAFARFRLGRQFEKQGEPAAAVEQYEISANLEPRVESIKRLISLNLKTKDRLGFVRSCERLYALPFIERAVPKIDLGLTNREEFAGYRDACLAQADAARPQALRASDPTGGSGQDGGVQRNLYRR